MEDPNSIKLEDHLPPAAEPRAEPKRPPYEPPQALSMADRRLGAGDCLPGSGDGGVCDIGLGARGACAVGIQGFS
jgi:SynChlorMet cassette protein ScmA